MSISESRRRALTLLSTLALTVQVTQAAEVDLADLSLEQLLEVKIVSASKFAQRGRDAPAAVQVISGEEIRRHGWRTLTEALNTLPGLYASNDKAYGFQGARGFQITGDYNTRFLLLVDGQQLMDRLQTALAVSARTRNFGAVLFLDMDRFKNINDTLGHDHGDLLLIEVAKRIQSCLRDADTVARVGGDEFVVILDELDTDAKLAVRKAAQVSEKIRLSLSDPYQLNEHERYSSPSIGVCMYLGTEVAAQVLIKSADVAMYQAKDDGRNLVRFFDVAMQKTGEASGLPDAKLCN